MSIKRRVNQVIDSLKHFGYSFEEASKIMTDFEEIFSKISVPKATKSLKRVLRRLSADSKKSIEDDRDRSI